MSLEGGIWRLEDRGWILGAGGWSLEAVERRDQVQVTTRHQASGLGTREQGVRLAQPWGCARVVRNICLVAYLFDKTEQGGSP